HALPLRTRPILDRSWHFRLPFGAAGQGNWTICSSFGRDHAAVCAALLARVWLACSPSGLIFLLYVLLAVLSPRIYIGIRARTTSLSASPECFRGSVSLAPSNWPTLLAAIAKPYRLDNTSE